MYKVFVNDCPIFLTDTKKISTGFEILNFESTLITQVIEAFLQKKKEGIYFYCDDLEADWDTFQSKFKIQKAAGGKVLNSDNEVLFIYRFNTWDLPKGKLEKGESIEECAFREVEEECGITNLTIKKELQTTYHIFERKGKAILKITYWFLMNSNYKGNLTPQFDEGIEKVEFKSISETKEALKNTYENIKLLF